MSGTPIELGDLSGLRDGQMRVFPDIGENGIIVCRVAGQLHALEDNCSHRDARLSEGRLRGSLITCPLHGAQFNVCDGQQQGPPAVLPVASFPVTEAGETAVVHLSPEVV
jgi:nitrite reductase/ring-hydroxylating ferredoxin subunit